MNTARKWLLVLLLACMPVLILACSGSPSNELTGSGTPAESPEAVDNQAEEAEEAAFPRNVQDADGELVIESKPAKIALVHWGLSEALLPFELQSLGLALPFTEKQSAIHSEQYEPYMNQIGEVTIIGENTTVNLEALLEYEPDLILAGSDMNKDIKDELLKIGTTYFIDESAINVWGDWRSVMQIFGELLGQEAKAQTFIDDFDAKLADAKSKVENTVGTVAFVQVRENAVWLQGRSLISHYYDGLGLTAPEGDVAEEGGQLSLEGLEVLNPDHLFLGYFNYSDPTLPALVDEWQTLEVWKSLKSVQEGQTYSINGEMALGYGPIGQAYGIDQIVEALQ